ncbi:Phenylacetic acid catabolic protein [Kitasatospora saccharophila]|uniref:Phenylacetic acid catabolic protein n=1 Tax=Kitasatospora saccharophila TaxID=407973 RepID=UPI003624DAC9
MDGRRRGRHRGRPRRAAARLDAVRHRGAGPRHPGAAGGDWRPGGGRRGLHTEAFGPLLAEMQALHRAHPGARW